VIARLGRNGTWLTPTLANRQADTTLRRTPPWHEDYVPELVRSDENVWVNDRGFRTSGLWFVRHVHRLGGFDNWLAGTDAVLGEGYDASQVWRLHKELALFVEAGLTPAEALRTATLNVARYWGSADSLGTVAPGKVADLVLLTSDPLKDIAHTRTIHGVVAGGRYYDRAVLDGIEADVQARDGRRP
jgi:cytosine/adenosine deaminase-related metal-dependent hydrolase